MIPGPIGAAAAAVSAVSYAATGNWAKAAEMTVMIAAEAIGAGVAVAAVKAVNVVRASARAQKVASAAAATYRSKNLAAQQKYGAYLSKKYMIGASRFTTEGKSLWHYDLVGPTHTNKKPGGVRQPVPTPHKVEQKRNPRAPNGLAGKDKNNTKAMSWRDLAKVHIRLARRK